MQPSSKKDSVKLERHHYYDNRPELELQTADSIANPPSMACPLDPHTNTCSTSLSSSSMIHSNMNFFLLLDQPHSLHCQSCLPATSTSNNKKKLTLKIIFKCSQLHLKFFHFPCTRSELIHFIFLRAIQRPFATPVAAAIRCVQEAESEYKNAKNIGRHSERRQEPYLDLSLLCKKRFGNQDGQAYEYDSTGDATTYDQGKNHFRSMFLSLMLRHQQPKPHSGKMKMDVEYHLRLLSSTSPLKLFFESESTRRLYKSRSVSGKCPSSELLFKLKTAKTESEPRPSGILPVNLFPSNTKVWRSVKDETASGNGPHKPRETNLRTFKLGSLASALTNERMENFLEICLIIPTTQSCWIVQKMLNSQKSLHLR
uniref:Uncharacterized protein n=1 Tax=Solanum lycopersicum TaxID=4081 RepID=A0A3Q7EGX1_SOLLC